MKRAIGLASVFALLLVACGGGTLESNDASTDGDAKGDAAKGDAAVEAGPLACGKVICQGTDYCVHPCCGGPAPQCLPLPDGGQCPSGFTPANCPNGPGCQQNPCTPAPPFCSPTPSCGSGGGGIPNGRDVSCVCA